MTTHPNRDRADQKLASAVEIAHDHEHDYSGLLLGVRESFEATTSAHGHLFATDAEGLNEVYLGALPTEERQLHNCHACRTFVNRYGGLVAIDESGRLIPAMWVLLEVPAFYHEAFLALHERVKRARVTSVFRSKDRVWGTPVTGAWSHLAVIPPKEMVYAERSRTAGQAMAASRESFRTVAAALADLSAPALDQALRLLRADALARSERFVGPVAWLRALHDRPKGRLGENVLWRAVAAAPEGYLHPRSSVVGPLLADVAAGLPFEEIRAKFNAMMHPLAYQRPRAAPAAGNVRAAEELVERLGIARSLERRFARLDEIHAVWKPVPTAAPPEAPGVFGHLATKDASRVPEVNLPSVTLTWEKFVRTVLPTAERLEVLVPTVGNFEAYLTAVHEDAPLIFKWDNPVSSYIYHGGSPATRWGLTPGRWAPVLAISPRPNLWSDPQPHLGTGVLLVIEGAADGMTDQGNGLFPEILKSELHEVRATIEAYSKAAPIGRPEGPLACGLEVSSRSGRCALRARSGGAWSVYDVDRWD